MTRHGHGEGGQATVELALVLPLLVMVLLAVIQVALVGRDSIAVTHAARAAARAAVVDPDAASEVAMSSTRLDGARMNVVVHGDARPGSMVDVTVTYDDPTDVPLIGRLIGDVELTESLSARVE